MQHGMVRLAPPLEDQFDDLADLHVAGLGWTKIPRVVRAGRLREQFATQSEISLAQLEHVLPWPNGVRVAQPYRFAAAQSPDHVGDDAILGPIAAADDIAAARGRDPQRVVGAAKPALKNQRHK